MGYELWVDMMSQPSRACAAFCAMNPQVGVATKLVLIHKRENRTPAYLEKNPMGTVPCLQVDGATPALVESCAILRKLARRPDVDAHWYRDNVERVDAALDWHHSAIRAGAARLVWHRAMAPRLGAKMMPDCAKEAADRLERSFKDLERFWLKDGDGPFVAGPKLTIADLVIACEIEQLCMLPPGDERTRYHESRADFPKVREFMRAVRSTAGAPYVAVHRTLEKVASAAQAKL